MCGQAAEIEIKVHRVLADHRIWLDSDGQSGKRADLSHAQLQGLSLWSADLREAALSYADSQGADMDHARLRGACLRHAKMEAVPLWQASLRDADLSYADLKRAKRDHADLSGAILHRTDLTDASLWGRGFPVLNSNAQLGSEPSSSKMPISANLPNPHLLLAIGDGKQAGDRLGIDEFEASRSANVRNEGFGNGSPSA